MIHAYSLFKTCYGPLLAGGLCVTAAKVSSVGLPDESNIMEFGIGVGAAVLLLREVFAYLRAVAEDKDKQDLKEMKELLFKINERLKSKD